SVIFANDMR
ncbi:hypothetical protein EC900039_5706B, partial [Escherichia coli 90.0039]